MAIVGYHDYTAENAFRVDLLNAIEAHDYHWDAFNLGDKDGTRTATLKAKVVADHDYVKVNELRRDVMAALDEHHYVLDTFTIGDKDEDRTLTVKALKNLLALATQMRVPGT